MACYTCTGLIVLEGVSGFLSDTVVRGVSVQVLIINGRGPKRRRR